VNVKETTVLSKRKWLNPKSSPDTGAVSYTLTVEKGDNWFVGNSDLSIWDCSRKIVLDISFYNKREWKQRIKKLNTLIESMEELREYVIATGEVEYDK